MSEKFLKIRGCWWKREYCSSSGGGLPDPVWLIAGILFLVKVIFPLNFGREAAATQCVAEEDNWRGLAQHRRQSFRQNPGGKILLNVWETEFITRYYFTNKGWGRSQNGTRFRFPSYLTGNQVEETSGLDFEICQDFCLDTGWRSSMVGIREVKGQPPPVGSS